MKTRDAIIILSLIFLAFVYHYAFTYLVKNFIPINPIITVASVIYITIFVLSKKLNNSLQLVLNVFSIFFLMAWITSLPLAIILTMSGDMRSFLFVMLTLYFVPIALILSNMIAIISEE